MTEVRSRERKTQSFYTPAAPSRKESKKVNSIEQGGYSILTAFSKVWIIAFNLKTELRGVQKKLEWDQELKKNEELDKATRHFKAQPLPNYEEMVVFNDLF